ncbi:DUF4825 domain-containing protein [Exiguobacterium sp. B2(2022)]|uniref:DUF4825 domain-containing protein n=1 Tax=Exiguobacterium sp. B2(2022) TaxID=2992755 RepID=UPI00237B4453|nr:DUF4825 domain-containing protein [Exiguobacterium sp. B2(2022)]MDE0564383.1 DUF4825 domain-containing protein [Exiguobacterium sp. B2(2022)]
MKRFCLLLVLAITLAGCTNPEPNAFEYRGSKVGDNAAVVGIAGSLPLHECYQSVELQTKKRPYGLTVRYEDPGMERAEQERLAIRNAATYFTLISNAEIVRFAFPNRTYAFSRPEMEAWFGTDFSNIRHENELQQLMNQKLEQLDSKDSYFRRV